MTKLDIIPEPAELALQWLIHNTGETYRSAAQRFGVKPGTIRGRIQHRFGTLAEAREANGVLDAAAPKVKRKCMVCKTPTLLDRAYRLCETCRRRVNSLHEGSV